MKIPEATCHICNGPIVDKVGVQSKGEHGPDEPWHYRACSQCGEIQGGPNAYVAHKHKHHTQ